MPMYDFTCQICQRPFRRNCMPHVALTVKYCSQKCRGLGRRRPNETVNCPICSTPYERRVGIRDHKTCGKRECWNALNGKNRTGRKQPPRPPEFRQKMREVRLALDHSGDKASNWQGGAVTRACEQCRQEFSGPRYYVTQRRFCSMACYQAWKRSVSTRPEHLRAIARVHNKIHDKHFQKVAKFIRSRDNHTCQNCQKHQTKPALHVHHIIPARWFLNTDDAHQGHNLISLCGPCHVRIEMGQIPCPVPPQKSAVPLAVATRRSLWRSVAGFKLVERERHSLYTQRTIMRFWQLALVCGHSVERAARYRSGRKSSHSPRVNRPIADLCPAPHVSRCPTCEGALLAAIR